LSLRFSIKESLIVVVAVVVAVVVVAVVIVVMIDTPIYYSVSVPK